MLTIFSFFDYRPTSGALQQQWSLLRPDLYGSYYTALIKECGLSSLVLPGYILPELPLELAPDIVSLLGKITWSLVDTNLSQIFTTSPILLEKLAAVITDYFLSVRGVLRE